MTKEEKRIYILQMLLEVRDPLIDRFFDDGEGLLDEKIEVLEGILEGKAPEDIPFYCDIVCIPDPEGEEDGNLILQEHWDL